MKKIGAYKLFNKFIIWIWNNVIFLNETITLLVFKANLVMLFGILLWSTSFMFQHDRYSCNKLWDKIETNNSYVFHRKQSWISVVNEEYFNFTMNNNTSFFSHNSTFFYNNFISFTISQFRINDITFDRRMLHTAKSISFLQFYG